MTRRACGIAATLLLLSFTVPALGKNYQLHSPKLWSQQEKEQYEKDNPPTDKEKALAERQNEQLKKEKEQAEKQKTLLKKEKEQAEKQKELLKKERERTEHQKEQLKKEKEQIKKQKEQLKKEKEQVKKEKERIKQDQIQVKDGVSYREVTVKKGDTLFAITRKFSKEGSSYSETLRFNDIKDPDQIVDGDIIKVPLYREKKEKQKQLKPARKQPVPAKAVQMTTPAKTGSIFSHTSTSRQKLGRTADAVITKTPAEVPPAPAKVSTPQPQIFSNNSASRQQLFEQAIKSYRSGDCQTAVQLFGRFLAGHTPSALAADASLFIADCYMKLSGK